MGGPEKEGRNSLWHKTTIGKRPITHYQLLDTYEDRQLSVENLRSAGKPMRGLEKERRNSHMLLANKRDIYHCLL